VRAINLNLDYCHVSIGKFFSRVTVDIDLEARSLSSTMAGSTPRDNPYLAHLQPSQRGAGPVTSNPPAKEPLFGFLPRKVKGEQVRNAMVCISISLDTTLRALTDKICLGARYKPIHQATLVSSVQKDTGITQETACVCTDGRVLQHGEYHDVRFLEEGLSSTSFRDGTDPPPRRRLSYSLC
jgi:hypothetical protein